MSKCYLCPVRCGADREKKRGVCGANDTIEIGCIMNHFGEEPPLVGKKGSGAVFFCGCPLKCVFCQNGEISIDGGGKVYTPTELENEFLRLNDCAENINLVTAGHYLDILIPILERVKPRLSVPIVYNSGGYETADAILRLKGLVDVYLPDYKYFSAELAEKYSHRPDYPETARAAISAAVENQPKPEFTNGLIKKGVIVRHLVLPGCRKDSIAVLDDTAKHWKDGVLLSLMRQYTPSFNRSDYPELNRSVTSFEYESVLSHARALGLKGFFQHKESIGSSMTPKFFKG